MFILCSCGRRLVMKKEHVGKIGKCPHCGKRIDLPARDAPIRELARVVENVKVDALPVTRPAPPAASPAPIHITFNAPPPPLPVSAAALMGFGIALFSSFLFWVPFVGAALAGLGLLLCFAAFFSLGETRGAGFAVFGGVIGAVALLAGLLFTWVAVFTVRELATSNPIASPVASSPINVLSVSEAAIVNSYAIKIERIVLGKVKTVTLLGNAITTEEGYLSVEIGVTNDHPTRKVDAWSWGSFGAFESSSDLAMLKDEFGNEYFIVHVAGSPVDVDFRSRHVLYPGETMRDLLVFERPVDGATELTLRLDVSLLTDEREFVSFLIPSSAVERS